MKKTDIAKKRYRIYVKGVKCVCNEVKWLGGKKTFVRNGSQFKWELTDCNEAYGGMDFNSVKAALNKAMDAMQFGHTAKWANVGLTDTRKIGHFVAETLVDENGNEVTGEEAAMWKCGMKTLWNCRIDAYLRVRCERDFYYMELKILK